MDDRDAKLLLELLQQYCQDHCGGDFTKFDTLTVTDLQIDLEDSL